MTRADDPDLSEAALDELVQSARNADATERVPLWRNAIARHGAAGIGRMTDLLGDPDLGAFAVTVIEKAAGHGHKAEAVRALRDGRDVAASNAIRSDLDNALVRLGAATRPTSKRPPIAVAIPSHLKVAPAFRDAHHLVFDYVQDSGTEHGDVYLFGCGRFFSGKWVRDHGDLQEPHGRDICAQCVQALERGT